MIALGFIHSPNGLLCARYWLGFWRYHSEKKTKIVLLWSLCCSDLFKAGQNVLFNFITDFRVPRKSFRNSKVVDIETSPSYFSFIHSYGEGTFHFYYSSKEGSFQNATIFFKCNFIFFNVFY